MFLTNAKNQQYIQSYNRIELKTSIIGCINNSGVAAPIIWHMSAISGLVSGSVSVYGGSTQSMSAVGQATHVSMTATEYDLQLNYHHVIPITEAPFSPMSMHQFENSQSLSNRAWITVTKKKYALFPLHPFVCPSSEHIVHHLSALELCSIIWTLSVCLLKWDSGHGCCIQHRAWWQPVVKHVPVHSKPDWLRGQRSQSPGASQLNNCTVNPTTSIVSPLQQSCFIRFHILWFTKVFLHLDNRGHLCLNHFTPYLLSFSKFNVE